MISNWKVSIKKKQVGKLRIINDEVLDFSVTEEIRESHLEEITSIFTQFLRDIDITSVVFILPLQQNKRKLFTKIPLTSNEVKNWEEVIAEACSRIGVRRYKFSDPRTDINIEQLSGENKHDQVMRLKDNISCWKSNDNIEMVYVGGILKDEGFLEAVMKETASEGNVDSINAFFLSDKRKKVWDAKTRSHKPKDDMRLTFFHNVYKERKLQMRRYYSKRYW